MEILSTEQARRFRTTSVVMQEVESNRFEPMEPILKICSRCKKEKPATLEFFPRGKGGRFYWCRICYSERAGKWCKTNPARAKANRARHMLLKRYGLTQEQYNEMMLKQDGVCAICMKPPNGKGRFSILHVDHCHATNKVRGLLCFGCNAGLGNMKDDPELLKAGAKYLEDYKDQACK